MQPRLIVHGGAWDIPPEQEPDHLAAVRRAVETVYPHLLAGMSALDAVEAAVRVLEDDPALNAGRGAVLNAQGEIELDAMLMDGKTLRVGAVGAVRNILHPVTLARVVMERSKHCFLVGSGANEFAREMGIAETHPRALITERELAYYLQHIRDNPSYTAGTTFGPTAADTVGAVAMDVEGNVAAATSTGGIPGKHPGRVGDAPIAGAGTYADNQTGAASATGWGEYIMRVVLTKTAADLLATLPAMEAAAAAIKVLHDRVQGLGGIILIDRHGNYGFAYNTPKMAFAKMEDAGVADVRILQ